MSERNPQQLERRGSPRTTDRAGRVLPSAGPRLRLADLCAPYRPCSPAAFPPHPLGIDDVRAAFAGLDENSWIEHRLSRMQLRCLPVEQLMDANDRPANGRPDDGAARERARYEGVNLALQDADSGQMKAMARLARRCALARGAGRRVLDLHYCLESLCVLPVQRNRGYDRVLASAVAALVSRELEALAQALWHTHTCAVQVAFTSRVDEHAGTALREIIVARLRDELVAQDSLLQLDGKLSRFLPLKA